ncbi:Phosphoglycolate phosphatase 1A chloroplastic [Zea mays]|uniref:Phosphoglycolate phosphatase 1A chloroplastic n=1 Tax=Zea mays TaxID=4577 RepID=A0A1D6J965_MAIZE|nr:Phosphoglycolate phosphatase 1A chloroplastic [Zea mays]
MLQVRASSAFLPSTSSPSPPSSSQAPAPAPFRLSGKSQRRGGLIAVPQASRVARRSVMAAAGAAAAAPAAAKLEDADALIDSVETFIFDCDGVIWKGDKLIDGVPETLDLLRSKGKRLVFVTNNSTKSRKQYGRKFETLGLSVDETGRGSLLACAQEEIFASSFAAAAYLQSIDFPKDKKVYVIGEEGILKELELAGFQYLGGPYGLTQLRFHRRAADRRRQEDRAQAWSLHGARRRCTYDPSPRSGGGCGMLLEVDQPNGTLLEGLFYRWERSWWDLIATSTTTKFSKSSELRIAEAYMYGTLCIRENPGCLFIATNRDAVTHLTDAQEWAGGGAMVGALLGSTKQEPLVVGKPSTFMMDYLAKK